MGFKLSEKESNIETAVADANDMQQQTDSERTLHRYRKQKSRIKNSIIDLRKTLESIKEDY